jgi:hypothetical protein
MGTKSEDNDMRVPDEVRECVAFIGVISQGADGAERVTYGGTAFLMSVPDTSRVDYSYTYLVTARHVAEAVHLAPWCIRLNTVYGAERINMTGGERWWFHPDTRVDVAVLGFVPQSPPFMYKTIPLSMCLADENLLSQQFGIGDEVFISGLFTRMRGRRKNLPISRLGSIAMMPDEPVPTRRGDVNAYLIEVRSIGGLSGSPVFTAGRLMIGGESKYYLLGLMHGHWDLSEEEEAAQGVQDLFVSEGKVNMGIAVVVPAAHIKETLMQSALQQERISSEERSKHAQVPPMD